jgi:hypothetical protein
MNRAFEQNHSDFTGATSEIRSLGREHREGKRFLPVQATVSVCCGSQF